MIVEWTVLDTWIVIAGALLAVACAIPGTYLMLTRQSMLGDGISHAVLPGLALAFLLSGSRDWTFMLMGAAGAAVLTAVLSQLVTTFGKVESGAALGVVFCSLFALGLVLIRVASDRVDLDPNCVLYGSIETSVINGVLGGTVPGVVWQALVLCVVNAGLSLLFYKELLISSFDSGMATAQGIRAGVFRFGVTLMTAVTAVLAFEAVGSILVIALLIVPPATAGILSHRLPTMLVLAGLAGVLAAGVGHALAISLVPMLMRATTGFPDLGSVSSAGMMAVASGGIFATVLLTVHWRQRRCPDRTVQDAADSSPDR